MRVLWLSNTSGSGSEVLGSGGTGGGWIKSLDKLLRDKIELTIAFHYPKPAKKFVHKSITYIPIIPKNWKLEWIKSRLLNKISDKKDLPAYKKIIEDVKPDIIHIHGTENSFGCIIDSTDIPIVLSIQGNITVCHHKFFSGFDSGLISKKQWKFKRFYDFPFYHSFRSSYNKFTKMKSIEQLTLSKCKNIIGRTDWDRRITKILAPGSRYFHGDEVLRDVFYEKKWVQPKTDKLILHTTTGNSPYKGFETLCHALNLLNELKINVEWRVAGIHEKDLIVKLTKKKLGNDYPGKGLVLLGGIGENELVEKLLEAHIYVMPSHIENSSNSLCEAMLIGMPCIASFAGGTGSILKDGAEGILIQDGDPWVLAGAIKELLENPQKAISMGLKARERALKRHDKQRIVNSLLSIYQDILTHSK